MAIKLGDTLDSAIEKKVIAVLEREQEIRRSINSSEASTVVVQGLSLTESPVNGLDFHMGAPTPEQLEKINSMISPGGTSAEEWFVCAFYASDNLVNRSMRRWSMNTLKQMEKGFVGEVLMIDHDWDRVESAIGFLFDSKLVVSKDAPLSTIDTPNKLESNRFIVQSEGHAALYLWGAISSDMTTIIEGLQGRRLNDCSTGGLLSQLRWFCPNCEQEKGRKVTFTEKDKYGDYVCPHYVPSNFLFAQEDEDDEGEYAAFVELDGLFDAIELSIVQSGNLPAASVVRS